MRSHTKDILQKGKVEMQSFLNRKINNQTHVNRMVTCILICNDHYKIFSLVNQEMNTG